MNYNFGTASTLYHGINPPDTNAEQTSLDELIAIAKKQDKDVIEGRITFVSPVSTFMYNYGTSKGTRGMVQSYTLTDVVAKENNHPIYTYRVTAWNEQVLNCVLEKDGYYRLSQFAWKQNSYAGKLPDHQSRYDIHLKQASIVEHVPV